MKQKNIILIFADQYRADCIGYDGNKSIMTPNLDDLAADSCYFKRAYTPSPTCVPARACLITGLKPSKTGFFSNDFTVPWNFSDTLMKRLQRVGYQTVNVGKNHFRPQRAKLGFDVNLLYETEVGEGGVVSDYHKWLKEKAGADFYETSEVQNHNGWQVFPWTADPMLHPTEWTMNTAIEQIARRDPNMPLYMQISFHRPHPPLDPPEYILRMYDNVEIEDSPVGDWAPQFSTETDDLFPFEGKIKSNYLRLAKKAYYAQITHIDMQIGKLIYFLKKEKLYEDCTIVFTADHGEMLGDHNMFRKGPPYEGSARIPFIVKFTNGQYDALRGKKINLPVSLLDIMPTFMNIAGLRKDDKLDGESIQDILSGNVKREYVIGENHRNNKKIKTGGSFVVSERYKYVWNSFFGIEMLFDLESDPKELKDISKDSNNIEILEKMRNIVKEDYYSRPYDHLLDENGNLKAGIVLPAYRKPNKF